MLILSKFHDYYDTALSGGVDKTCVYNRNTTDLLHHYSDDQLDGADYCEKKKHSGVYRNFDVYRGLVGFCGEIYPFIRVEERKDGVLKYPHWTFYDTEKFLEFAEENFPKAVEADRFPKGKWKRWWVLRRANLSEESLDVFFDPYRWRAFKGLFLTHKVPVFSYISPHVSRRRHKLHLNPKLKDLDFMKVRDPYTACQEIHMYLSGVLGMADRDTAEVGNDDRIAQRGFDKWSFRREPGEKQRKGKPKSKRTLP